MKNTKPNRDITAEILKEYYKKFPYVLKPGLAGSFLGIQDEVAKFLEQALTKQKEEIVKSLRMRKKPLEEWMLGQDVGYNKAVDEFNQKLDRLK